MKRSLQLGITVLALATMTLAGCGEQPKDQIATANGGKSTSEPKQAGTEKKLSDHEKALKFAACLRGEGIDVPDPEPGGGMKFKATGKNMSREKMQKAFQKCQKYAPTGMLDRKNDPKAKAQVAKWAKCMRAEGVEVPDPGPEGMPEITEEVFKDPQFKAAQKKCGKGLMMRRTK